MNLSIKKLLHPNQIYILKNLQRFNVIAAGRRFGKTRIAAFNLIISALTVVGVYWWVSPTWSVGTPAWRLINTVLRDAKIIETTRTIYLPNGSIIEFKSADNPDSLRGEGLSGLVIDECAQIKEDAWTLSLRPSLSENLGWVIFIGTPKGRNWFYFLYLKAESTPGWARFKFTSYDNPHIPLGEIDSAKADMSDLEFRQEYLAEFISESGAIYKRDWFINRGVPSSTEFVTISWDTASSVSDAAAYSSCVVGTLDKNLKLYITEVYRAKLEFPQLKNAIETMANKYRSKLKYIVIESKNSGISVIQSLKQSSPDWIAGMLFPFTPTTDKVGRGYLASQWSENGSVILPPHNESNPWLLEFEEELFSAPESPYLDSFDAFNQLCLVLADYLKYGLQERLN